LRALTITLLLTSGATWTGQAWWDVPTDSDTTAEVRGVLVPRLREHHRDVRAHKAHLRHLAAQEAQEAAPVAPVAAYSGGCLTSDQVAAYARSAGFPEWAIPTMVAYAYRESHFCPGAINGTSGACGLWQANPCYGGAAWLAPGTNAAIAFQKFSAPYPGGGYYGFHPWGGATVASIR